MTALPDLRPGTNGDCFEASLMCAMELAASNPDPDHSKVYVCHGLPIGRGPTNKGKRYWHGWVEVVGGVAPMCFDFSMGRRIAMKRAQYYREGQIDGSAVHRYDFEVVARGILLVRALGFEPTCGPWVDGWESMGD